MRSKSDQLTRAYQSVREVLDAVAIAQRQLYRPYLEANDPAIVYGGARTRRLYAAQHPQWAGQTFDVLARLRVALNGARRHLEQVGDELRPASGGEFTLHRRTRESAHRWTIDAAERLLGELTAHLDIMPERINPTGSAAWVESNRERLTDGLADFVDGVTTISEAALPPFDLENMRSRLRGELRRAIVAPKQRRARRPRRTGEARALTEKQLQVVQLYGECKGCFAQIGRVLGITGEGARFHWKAAAKKLGPRLSKIIAQPPMGRRQALPTDHRGQVTVSGK